MPVARDYDTEARLEAVEGENEILRERIVQLEEAMGYRFVAPVVLGLTACESAMLGCLMARDLASKEALHGATIKPGADEPSMVKIVDVFICKMRKKLSPFGIEIGTRWGHGYFISPPMKDVVRRLMEGAA